MEAIKKIVMMKQTEKKMRRMWMGIMATLETMISTMDQNISLRNSLSIITKVNPKTLHLILKAVPLAIQNNIRNISSSIRNTMTKCQKLTNRHILVKCLPKKR
jgi:hypothetical protein